MTSLRVHTLLPLALILACASPAVRTSAQNPTPPPPDQNDVAADYQGPAPAHVAVVDGTATLTREGDADSNLTAGPLLAGDRIATTRGRVEVRYGDGTVLDLDDNTTVDLLSDALVRMRSGRVRVGVARDARDVNYRIDTSAGFATIGAPGEYRVDLATSRSGAPEVNLLVVRGAADLVNDAGRAQVQGGTSAIADAGMAPSGPYASNSAQTDAFDTWADGLTSAASASPSAGYLPADVRPYSTEFDRDGTWSNVPDYGRVWYPRVEAGWRPYSNGRWSFFSALGWTFLGTDAWAWPTHHYGRWGISADRWFWIPDNQFGPAWVSWASAPGYIGWCPLGRDGLAVYGASRLGLGFDAWGGWTVIPSRAFAPNVFISRYAVNGRLLAPEVRGAFAAQRSVPVARPILARTASQPLRGPSRSFAASRGESTRIATGNDRGLASRAQPDARNDVRSAPSGSASSYGRPSAQSAPFASRSTSASAARETVPSHQPYSSPGATSYGRQTTSPQRAPSSYGRSGISPQGATSYGRSFDGRTLSSTQSIRSMPSYGRSSESSSAATRYGRSTNDLSRLSGSVADRRPSGSLERTPASPNRSTPGSRPAFSSAPQSQHRAVGPVSSHSSTSRNGSTSSAQAKRRDR